jgi:hypothetical protein
VSQLDHFAIRIFGNRVWPNESPKTIFVTKVQTANEGISLALEKFKYQGVTAAMFQLVKVHADGSGKIFSFPFLSFFSFLN